MKTKEWILTIVILTGIICLFFYKTVTGGNVPFPGDILISDFQPWRSTSYIGYGAGGFPNKAQYPDVIRQLYPWKTLVVDALKQNRLPLWNPYNFSGAPLLANFQSAALYPLNIFYFLFSQVDAWALLIIFQPFLAMLFTYLYARKIGIGALGSSLSAVSFGLSGFMAVWLEYNTVGHVILWLPLSLLAIEYLKEKPIPLWLGVLTFTQAASLLAGHPQVYAYSLTFVLIYAVFRAKKRMWWYILGFILLGIGGGGLQLIPGIELISNAARSPHDPTNLFTKILIQPWQLLSLPFPNIFGNPATRTYWPADTFVGKVTTIGLIPLFFFLSALRRKDDLTKWFIRALVIVLVLITANPLTYILYKIPLPLITSSSPTLMSFLLAFTLSILCGMGLDYWMTDKHSTKKLVIRSVEVAALLGLCILATKLPIFPLFSEHARTVTRAILYAGAISGATLILFWIAIRIPKYRTHAIIILLLVHTLDLFIFFNRFNPFVPKALVFPDHPILTYLKNKSPDRFWGYGTANMPANFASQYALFSPEGYDPLYPKWYGEYLYSYRDGKMMKTFDNATRSDAAIASNFGDGGLSNVHKQSVINALSVRYILDRTENMSNAELFPPETYKIVYSVEDWRIYENTKADHRVALTGGTADILSYEPERVIIQTESSVSGILTLTDTYYPGWLATIDGSPTLIQQTDTALRSLSVPSGKHTILFIYKPLSVRYGAFLSMISTTVTALGLIALVRKKV